MSKTIDPHQHTPKRRRAATHVEPDEDAESLEYFDFTECSDEPQSDASHPATAKVIAISGRRASRRDTNAQGDHEWEEEDLPDIDNSVFWVDPPGEEQFETVPALPHERVAAILVQGCFAIYHLVREHRCRRTRVPEYLLRFARTYEEPIIPAAETIYLRYFDDACEPEEIPERLLDLGLSTAAQVAACIPHALRLHHLLEAFAVDGDNAQRSFCRNMLPGDEMLCLLLGAMLGEYRRWFESRNRFKPI